MFKGLPTSKLLRQIARFNLISANPRAAYKLGPDIKRLELFLVHKNVYKPGAGLKKFWRENLPALKFHNDDVEFVVLRFVAPDKTQLSQAPCILRVHRKDGKYTDLDCSLKSNVDIMRRMVKETGAVRVPEEDLEVMPYPKGYQE